MVDTLLLEAPVTNKIPQLWSQPMKRQEETAVFSLYCEMKQPHPMAEPFLLGGNGFSVFIPEARYARGLGQLAVRRIQRSFLRRSFAGHETDFLRAMQALFPTIKIGNLFLWNSEYTKI